MLPLECLPHSVPLARSFARQVCLDSGCDPERCDAVELVVSELVSNAVRHSQGPLALDVHATVRDVLILVQDGDATPPGGVVACAPAESEGGRGMFLVDALAQRWGWELLASGKAVWARV